MKEVNPNNRPISSRTYVFSGGSLSGSQLAGVFYINSQKSAADISDGLSNTAFVGEVCTTPGEDFQGALHYPEGPLYQHNYTPNSSVPDLIRSGYCVDVDYAPCDKTNVSTYSDRNIIMTARSMHPGGVHLLLGDGSVRFISDNISLDAWQALSTPRALPGENTLSGDF